MIWTLNIWDRVLFVIRIFAEAISLTFFISALLKWNYSCFWFRSDFEQENSVFYFRQYIFLFFNQLDLSHFNTKTKQVLVHLVLLWPRMNKFKVIEFWNLKAENFLHVFITCFSITDFCTFCFILEQCLQLIRVFKRGR